MSCTKTYWLAILAALDDQQKAEIAKRIDCIPPYGKRVPNFNGKRCIEKAAELNEKEYEGLMRTVVFVVVGLLPTEVAKFWRELSEVGVQREIRLD